MSTKTGMLAWYIWVLGPSNARLRFRKKKTKREQDIPQGQGEKKRGKTVVPIGMRRRGLKVKSV